MDCFITITLLEWINLWQCVSICFWQKSTMCAFTCCERLQRSFRWSAQSYRVYICRWDKSVEFHGRRIQPAFVIVERAPIIEVYSTIAILTTECAAFSETDHALFLLRLLPLLFAEMFTIFVIFFRITSLSDVIFIFWKHLARLRLWFCLNMNFYTMLKELLFAATFDLIFGVIRKEANKPLTVPTCSFQSVLIKQKSYVLPLPVNFLVCDRSAERLETAEETGRSGIFCAGRLPPLSLRSESHSGNS